MRTMRTYALYWKNVLCRLEADNLNRMGSALLDIPSGISDDLRRKLAQENMHSEHRGLAFFGALDGSFVALQVFFAGIRNLYLGKPGPLKRRDGVCWTHQISAGSVF